MKTARSAFVLFLLALLAPSAFGCGDERVAASRCPTVCPCTEDGCAPGWCGVHLALEASCAEAAPIAEVYVAGCLETEDVTLPEDGGEATRVPCGAIAEGTAESVVVRGDSIQWGPLNVDCPDGGGLLYPVRLSCP